MPTLAILDFGWGLFNNSATATQLISPIPSYKIQPKIRKSRGLMRPENNESYHKTNKVEIKNEFDLI